MLSRHLHPPQTIVFVLAGLLGLLAGCSPPVGVEPGEPTEIRRELTSSVANSGNLSEPTRIVLHQQSLSDQFETDPEGAIASLHRTITEGWSTSDILFALAETTFYRAHATGKRPYFLAAVVYACEFLFPDDVSQRPSGFDTRFRAACDIYDRSLAAAFASADGSRVMLASGRYQLPFGTIDVAFDSPGAQWGSEKLSNFTSTDTLSVKGLSIRYWHSGIGAPLAADATSQMQEAGFQLEPNIKVPVTALLRVEGSLHEIAQGHLRGSLEVHPAFEPSNVTIAGQSVPLEVDTSAAFAFSLDNPKVWQSEYSGFLNGNFFDRSAAQLVSLEPFRPDQFPVVFIHGTGSSSGRWANLINDLQSDPVIREHFQFWSFSYATGNPAAYSAEELREEIEDGSRSSTQEAQIRCCDRWS